MADNYGAIAYSPSTKAYSWAYDFPSRELLPIAGLVAFYNEKVDTFVDGVLLERPQSHFAPKRD